MATKSISIPSKRSARLASARADSDVALADADGIAAEAPAVVKRPNRQVRDAPTHRYRVGERLRMGGGGYSVSRVAAVCKVLALLPYEGTGALRYRVRSEAEAFERVVAETDLSRG